MRKQFKNTLIDLNDERIAVLLGDVSVYLFEGSGLFNVFNLTIGENTLVSAAAGMASQGFIPFVHTISPFLIERSFEQIKLDMCYNKFHGNLVSCGASFDYAHDGTSHHTFNDLAILQGLPIEIIQPGSDKEVEVLIKSQYDSDITTYFRLSDYPHNIDMPVEFGKGVELLNKGSNITVITSGPILGNVMPAVKNLDVNLLYFHTLKPIDKNLILKYKDTILIVIQDANGLFEAISNIGRLDMIKYNNYDRFYTRYGTVEDARTYFGLDIDTIKRRIECFMMRN